jgi:hypothetical protein
MGYLFMFLLRPCCTWGGGWGGKLQNWLNNPHMEPNRAHTCQKQNAFAKTLSIACQIIVTKKRGRTCKLNNASFKLHKKGNYMEMCKSWRDQ